jgi:hypothetical protein
MFVASKVHIGDSEQIIRFLAGTVIGPGISLAGVRLRERSRARVNVFVQNGHGAKSLQVRKHPLTVVGARTPFGIRRPKRGATVTSAGCSSMWKRLSLSTQAARDNPDHLL